MDKAGKTHNLAPHVSRLESFTFQSLGHLFYKVKNKKWSRNRFFSVFYLKAAYFSSSVFKGCMFIRIFKSLITSWGPLFDKNKASRIVTAGKIGHFWGNLTKTRIIKKTTISSKNKLLETGPVQNKYFL